MCSALDKLDDFRNYESNILSVLRKAVDEGWSTRRIRKELATFSQALVIQQGLCGNVNRSSQFTAIRDVLDRNERRSYRKTGKTNTTTRMSREELVALAYQKLVDAGFIPGGAEER
jgi:hypothetical protein